MGLRILRLVCKSARVTAHSILRMQSWYPRKPSHRFATSCIMRRSDSGHVRRSSHSANASASRRVRWATRLAWILHWCPQYTCRCPMSAASIWFTSQMFLQTRQTCAREYRPVCRCCWNRVRSVVKRMLRAQWRLHCAIVCFCGRVRVCVLCARFRPVAGVRGNPDDTMLNIIVWVR